MLKLSVNYSLLLLLVNYSLRSKAAKQREYCIIGAGPAGLQMGHFLQEAGRDYVIFERNNVSGSFYLKYPRHRQLISINKRNTGSTNREFNLRQDWNSLISIGDKIAFTSYSKEYFPPADRMLDYLADYRTVHNISVQFNQRMGGLQRVGDEHCVFRMQNQRNETACCRTVLLGTGMDVPNIPDIGGVEHTVGYEDMSLDPQGILDLDYAGLRRIKIGSYIQDYEGKSVLILGLGNSGLEIAKGLYGVANLVHLVSRSRVRFSWDTHYVGDIRGINNEVVDAYMLKSLDGIFSSNARKFRVVPRGNKSLMNNIFVRGVTDVVDFYEYNFDQGPQDGRLMLMRKRSKPDLMDNNPSRHGYDIVIRAAGFKWNRTIFHSASAHPNATINGREVDKYPSQGPDFQSSSHPGLYFIGALTHARDYRKSAGGFIHGFRYNARVLHRLLEWRNHGVPWPFVTKPQDQLLSSVMKRANENPGIYQMFQFLADIVIIDRTKANDITYLEEVPIDLIPKLAEITGHQFDDAKHDLIVLTLQYGANFSQAGEDHFDRTRVTSRVAIAHLSNFLHPVIHYYRRLPTQKEWEDKNSTMPESDGIHHVLEDFTTGFEGPKTHLLPLRRFFELILEQDLRVFLRPTCLEMVLKSGMGNLPHYCANTYLQQIPSSFAFAL